MGQDSPLEKTPLDEVMLAMDVVDTLRHRERLIERALSADVQDRELIARLKDIYAGQGIAVSDEVLARGVRDLREDRFAYTPPPPSLAVSLARIYASRGRWAKPLVTMLVLVAAVLLGYRFLVRGPELARLAALPTSLQASHAAVVAVAEEPAAASSAATLLRDGQLALQRENYAQARAAIAELDGLRETLTQSYELRVLSRPGELSGVWRVPDLNPAAQNYYLIVEAIDADGNRLTLPIVNEENDRTYRVSRWGVRVDEATFQAVASDKQDDGIIQDAVVAVKRRGRLELEYRPGALGGAITQW